jgi:hypothetical protein
MQQNQRDEIMRLASQLANARTQRFAYINRVSLPGRGLTRDKVEIDVFNAERALSFYLRDLMEANHAPVGNAADEVCKYIGTGAPRSPATVDCGSVMQSSDRR